MNEVDEYRIKIKKGDFEIDVKGDKEWVETKFQELLDEIKKIESVATIPSIPALEHVKTTFPNTLTELYRKAGEPRKFNDKILLFTYWLSNKHDADRVNSEDMHKCFDDVKLKKPANMTDIMRKIDKDLFLEAAEKDGMKAYKLSLKGEEYVENMISGT